MPKPNTRCKMCKKLFYAKPNWTKRGWGKYCSVKCQHEGYKNGKVIKCYTCNKEVYKPKRALKHSISKKYFCSKSCQALWRNSLYIGPKHPNWKGGKYAYKSILRRNKILEFCRVCKTTDTRVLVTHHINGNHKNNRLNNLVWLCHNCHFLVHNIKGEKEKFMEALV